MTSTAAEVMAGIPPVGTRITTRELAHAAAVAGVTLHNRRSGYRIEVLNRGDDGPMYYNSHTMHWTSPERASTDGRLEITGIPVMPGIPIGTAVHTRADLAALPDGTRVRNTRGTVYIKDGEVLRSVNSGDWNRPFDYFQMETSGFVVVSPASALSLEGVDEETPVQTLSLSRYMQRFRTKIWGSILRASVQGSAVDQALEELGLTEDFDMGVGMAVSGLDTDLARRLPVGTVLRIGRNPADFSRFGVLRKANEGPRSWTRLVGGVSVAWIGERYLGEVIAMPENWEQPDWLREEWTPDTPRRVAAFRAKAWQVGGQAQARTRWCGEYQSAMAQAGVTEDRVQRAAILGSAEEIAAQPEGTIVRLDMMDQDSVLYLRDDRSTNPARTLRIAGTLPGAWVQGGVTVVRRPREPVHIGVLSHAEMEAMPVGTALRDAGGSVFEKRPAMPDTAVGREWFIRNQHHRTGYFARDLHLGGCYYMEIGGL